MEKLAEQIADAVIAKLERRRARKQAMKKPPQPVPVAPVLRTLGTTKFKPMDGLYPSVAAQLGVARRYVYGVAKGQFRSKRVLQALRDEIVRRLTSAEGGPA